MKKIVFILCLILLNNTWARSVRNNNPLSPENFKLPSSNPDERSNEKIDDLKVNKFYLNIDPKKLKSVQKRNKRNKHLLDGFDDITINQKPVVKSISSQEVISMHPYYSTTFLLPKGSVINYARGKMFEKISFDQNMLTVDINNNFDRGNLVIVYSEKKQNKILNILVKKFDKNEIKNEVLNTLYSYRNEVIMDDLEIIQAYVKEYGKYPDSKNNYIYIGDVVYRIVKDNKYGNVFVKGEKYRIETGVIRK